MYYFELSLVFFLFMLIGAVFTPFFGGCLILIAFFALLGAFIVFFSLNFIWFLLAGVIIYTYGFLFKYWKWKKLPEVNQYLATNPDCKLPNGVSCNKCGSEKLNHVGLFNKRSKWRFYVCSQCGSILFRFKVL